MSQRVSIYIPDKLFIRIKVAAKKDIRTISNYLANLLHDNVPELKEETKNDKS